ncbi:MAG: hypothetical protein ACRDVP_02835 [Acidimicrobiales bacterium]
MTTEATISCVLCGDPATESIEPPRKTLARGIDPGDPSYSVTVILPKVSVCAAHAHDVHHGDRAIGWCDDERCRTYGELGQPSACGDPYKKLNPGRS